MPRCAPFSALFLLSFATLPASAQTAREAVAHPELSYQVALEALGRGNGEVAITMLDASIAGLPATAHLALHERLLRLAEAYIVMGQPDSADVMLDRARAEMLLMADSAGWEMAFDTASDERLMKLMERVATAGRPVTAFRIQLLREARGGARSEALDTLSAFDPARVPENTALVAYAVSASGQRVMLLVATRGGLRAVPLHTSDSLATQVAHLWMALAAGSDAPRDAAALSNQLILPLLERLPRDITQLAFVPGGPLRALPFDVLPLSGNRRLIETFETTRASVGRPGARLVVGTDAAGRHSHRGVRLFRRRETARSVPRRGAGARDQPLLAPGRGASRARRHGVLVPARRPAKRRHPAPCGADAHHRHHRWRRRPGNGVDAGRGWPARCRRAGPTAPRRHLRAALGLPVASRT